MYSLTATRLGGGRLARLISCSDFFFFSSNIKGKSGLGMRL